MGVPCLGWTYSLTLNEAIECALSHNARIKLSELDVQNTNKQIESLKRQKKPVGSLHVYTDVEKNNHGVQANDVKRTGVSPRLSYRSMLGTELHMQWNQAYHTNPMHSDERRAQWQVRLEQPLLQGARMKVNRAQDTEVEYQKELRSLHSRDTQAHVLLQVIQDYILLYNTWQSFELQSTRFHNQKMMQTLIEEKIALGRISEVDGMAFNIQLAKLEQMLNQTNMQLIQQSNGLARVIGKELEVPQPIEALNLNRDFIQTDLDYNALALTKHLKPLTLQSEQLKHQEMLIRDHYLWDLRLKGVMSQGRQAYHYDEDFDYDLTRHVHTQKHRYLGLFLTIPLTGSPSLDLSLYQNKSSQYKHQLETQQIQLEISQRVAQLKHQVNHWRRQQTIAAQSYQLAQKTLKVEEHKYLAGRASFYDWQLAQEMELQAAMNVESTQAGYFLAQVELDYIAGLLPQRWPHYEIKH